MNSRLRSAADVVSVGFMVHSPRLLPPPASPNGDRVRRRSEGAPDVERRAHEQALVAAVGAAGLRERFEAPQLAEEDAEIAHRADVNIPVQRWPGFWRRIVARDSRDLRVA